MPALLLGALLMHRHGVPPVLWAQNLVAGLLLTALCAAWRAMSPRPAGRRWPRWIAALILFGLLLATFADAGSEGVHRWVRLGPVRLHVAAACLPLLLLALGANHLSAGGRPVGWPLAGLGAGTVALLALQPDAAQATALAGALLALLLSRPRPAWLTWPAALLSGICAAWAWGRPDPIPPVPHVEGIVEWAAQSGGLWMPAALVSLALLPLPFLVAWLRGEPWSATALAFAVYFGLAVAAPWFGSFPVPLLGFGLSPILGYFSALGWLVAASPPRPKPPDPARQRTPPGAHGGCGATPAAPRLPL